MSEPAPLVPIQDEDGSVSYVRQGDLAAVKAEGARVATQDEIDRANYRGGLAGAAATADALARGATFGASDWLQVEGARALGGEDAAAQMAAKTRLLRDEFADTTGAAEFAGGFLLPVPGSGLAKGAAGAIGKGLVGAVERAGLRGLEGIAGHVIPGALTAGYEGAVMGAGQALSESALGDRNLTAERLFAHAEKAGLLGMGIGAALHLPLARLGGVTPAIERAAGGEATALARAERAATRAEEAAVSAAEHAPRPAGGGMLERLQGMADEEGYRALGGLSKQYKKLGSTAEAQLERAQGIGKLLRDEGVISPLATKAEMAEKIAAKVKATGEEIGAQIRKLDETGVRFDTTSFLERARAEVLAPLAEKVGYDAEAKAVANYLESFAEKVKEPSFERLHQHRVEFDRKLKFDAVSAGGATEELRKVRSIMEQEFTAKAEEAAKLKGEAFADAYQTTKQRYSMLKDAESAVKTGLDRKGVNRTWSLTDAIMAAPAVAALGPVGLLAAGANKALREFGSQTASVLLDRVAKVEQVQRAAAAVDQQIERAVGAIKGGAARKLPAGARVSQQEAQVTAERVLANPDALAARVQSFVGTKLRELAPDTADAVSSVATRAAMHLQGNAPKPLPPQNRLQPQLAKPTYAPADVARFAKRIEAVRDPVGSVTRGLESGDISREQVEAVKAVYPKLYSVMQGRLMEEVAKLPRELPYSTRVALSVLFEVPLDASMQPAAIRGFQASYTPAEKAGAPRPTPLNPDVFRRSSAPASARLEGPPGD